MLVVVISKTWAYSFRLISKSLCLMTFGLLKHMQNELKLGFNVADLMVCYSNVKYTLLNFKL